jgi:hypothetical protein
MHAVNNQDKRLGKRDDRKQIAKPGDDLLSASVRILVEIAFHLSIGRELRKSRDHRTRSVSVSGASPRFRDERDHLVEWLVS